MSDALPTGRPQSRAYEALPAFYFQEIADTFSRAAATTPPREFLLNLAGVKILLRFAGEALLPKLMPALEHLVSQPSGPVDWTICCWDDKTTGSAMPEPTPVMRNRHQRNCLYSLSNERYRAFLQEWMGSLCVIDLHQRTAYSGYWEGESLPMYELAAPMRQIFNAILNQHGRQLIHAAALGSAQGTVLLAGPPRSGKSTLAVQGLLWGMAYQSDDLCVISQEEQPRSWSIYNIAKLRQDSVNRMKGNVPPLSYFVEGAEKKAFFHVSRHFARQLLKESAIRALVIPAITGEASSRLRPANRIDAMRALIPWSVSEVPTSDNLGEKIMLKALGGFPAYHLEVGYDVRQTLALLEGLINE